MVDLLNNICPNTSLQFRLEATDPLNLSLTYAIVTWPAHGTLDTSDLPQVTYYAPTNCYEGQDSFTFTVSDGQHTSAPATVILYISSGVSASPVSAQTCRGTPVGVTLSGGDSCGQSQLCPAIQSAHGTLDTSFNTLHYLHPQRRRLHRHGQLQLRSNRSMRLFGHEHRYHNQRRRGNYFQRPDVDDGNQPAAEYHVDGQQSAGLRQCVQLFHRQRSGPRNLERNAARTASTRPTLKVVDSFRFNANDGVWTSISSAPSPFMSWPARF